MGLAKVVGTMIVEGAEYAVLDGAEGAPQKPWQAASMKVELDAPSFLVSRVFSNEAMSEGVSFIEKTYAPPHWVTIAGPAIIHWAIEPYSVATEVIALPE